MIRIEIEKFLQTNLKKLIQNQNQQRKLYGKFMEEGSAKIHEGDNFMAYELAKCSAFEVYECYIKYFNHTITNNEKIRFPVSAEWEDEIIEGE